MTAIEKSGNVVIAADRVYEESAHGRRLIRVEPLAEFRRAGAASGFAAVNRDADGVIRNVPQGDDIFWRVIVRSVNEKHPGVLDLAEPDQHAMIRYAGPEQTPPPCSGFIDVSAGGILLAQVPVSLRVEAGESRVEHRSAEANAT